MRGPESRDTINLSDALTLQQDVNLHLKLLIQHSEQTFAIQVDHFFNRRGGSSLLLRAPGLAQSQAPTGQNASAMIDKARNQEQARDFKDALTTVNAALEIDPKSVQGLVVRGDIKDQMGDRQGALIDYNSALAIDPQYEYAFETKCSTEIEINANADAIGDCNKALTLDPRDSDALRFRAQARYWLNDDAGALTDANASLAIDATSSRGYVLRCDILRDMGVTRARSTIATRDAGWTRTTVGPSTSADCSTTIWSVTPMRRPICEPIGRRIPTITTWRTRWRAPSTG
jgi:tetratricopeptide (TPR) repeat protein